MIDDKPKDRRKDFSPMPTAPDCTHRNVIGYNIKHTGEPAAFWSCLECGRRFEPTHYRDRQRD